MKVEAHKPDLLKNKAKKRFGKDAAVYNDSINARHAMALYPAVVRRIISLKPEAVLDIGCGPGNILALLQATIGSKLAGIDISSEMAEIARKRVPAADIRIGDSESLPWSEDKFDAVICTDSFHHYPAPEKVLREIRRVLKTGGKFILADPWCPTPVRQLINFFLPISPYGDVKIYSEKEVKYMLVYEGFEKITWEKAGKCAFLSCAEKQ